MESPLAKLRSRLDELRLFESSETRRRFAIHALIAIVAVVAIAVVVQWYFPFLTDADEMRAFVRGFGPLGPVVIVVVQAVQVVVAPVPGQVLAVVAGYLYGPWLGTLYNMVGIAAGSTVAFWLSKRYGRSYVESVVHEDALARLDALDDHHTRLGLFFLFLLPGLPDDVLCFAGGLTRLPLWQLVLIAIAGRAPAFFAVNVVGDLLQTDQFAPAIAVTAVLLVVSLVGYLYRERLVALVGGE